MRILRSTGTPRRDGGTVPQSLKLVVIELAGLGVIVGGVWSLIAAGNSLGLVAVLVGQRLLLRPAHIDTLLDRVLDLAAKALTRGPPAS